MIGGDVKTIIGVDTGKSGALVAVQRYGDKYTIDRYLDIKKSTEFVNVDEMNLFIRSYDPKTTLISVENPHIHPEDGIKSMSSAFEYGKAVGLLWGLCYGTEYVSYFISPSIWKNRMGITAPNQDRQFKKELAMQLALKSIVDWDRETLSYPMKRNGEEVKINKFDRAEAFLMGVYGFIEIVNPNLENELYTFGVK